jgi:peptidoglycan/LPS O-acetylase OafA/YrhL
MVQRLLARSDYLPHAAFTIESLQESNRRKGSPDLIEPRRKLQMKQRNDIDGLRAVAVLPVVLFHYNFLKLMPGGYIGVDIFFVISGFLITRIIYDGIADGSYSIADFYYRRVRRIFPALFAMFAFCLVTAFLISFPSDAHDVGHSVLASTFFVSNILFYLSSGYFDQASEINPLLHTWSLSVEEQFYVLFPLLVFAIRKFSNQTRIRILFAIALASFIASSVMLPRDGSAVFYLVQYRAWELLLGSLLALGAVPQIRRPWVAESLGVLGLTMIVASIMLYSSVTPFPGYSALLPCLGAALIIYSGTAATTTVGRLLSLAPVRFVGLVSYSFYLWHWPILVFYRYYFMHEPHGLVERGALIAVTFLISVLSWHFIEKPFRVRREKTDVPRTLRAAGSAMLAFSLFGLVLGPANAQFWQYPGRVTSTMNYVDYEVTDMMRTGQCFMSTSAGDFKRFDKSACLALDVRKPNYLIFGDSHAAHLWYGLKKTYPDVNFMQATSSGCKPLIGRKSDPTCNSMVNYIASDFAPRSHPDAIILSANWQTSDAADLKKTINALREYTNRVIVFGPIAIYDQPLPRILARGLYDGDPAIVLRHSVPGRDQIDRQLFHALRTTDSDYVSLYRTLCRPGCITWIDRTIPLQYDYGHLTREGSVFIASLLDKRMFGTTR